MLLDILIFILFNRIIQPGIELDQQDDQQQQLWAEVMGTLREQHR
jgi:hypothetical protein